MIPLIGKRIAATTVADARFPEGLSIEEVFDLKVEVGSRIRIDFDDHTSLIFVGIDDPSPEGDTLVIMRTGTWREGEGGRIEVVT